MYRRKHRVEHLHGRARIVLAGLVAVGVAGCAGEPTLDSDGARAGAVPYVGVFTGEFVDGKPLYRLPTIEVVGSRDRGADGT